MVLCLQICVLQDSKGYQHQDTITNGHYPVSMTMQPDGHLVTRTRHHMIHVDADSREDMMSYVGLVDTDPRQKCNSLIDHHH